MLFSKISNQKSIANATQSEFTVLNQFIILLKIYICYKIEMSQNIQWKKKNNGQTSFDNKSKKSSSSSEDSNDQLILPNQSKVTVLENILNYFDFFQQNLGSTFKQFHSNLIETFAQTEIIQFLESTSQKERNQFFQKKLVCPQQIKNKNLSFLQTYQQFHRTRLEERLLKSGRFKKVDSFRTDLLIEEIHSTNHCQIIKLEIQLLWYKTQVLILNDFKKSLLTSVSQISDSGSFGTVYLLRTSKEEFGIKCLPLQKTENDKNYCKNLFYNSQIIIDGIKEYFLILLLSQMQIGPKAKKIGGFDMVLNKDYIEFCTQICQPLKKEDYQKLKRDLSESLFEMHMLQIVHQDIKPSNIMFSPTFKKYVFIDFGCSDGLKQNIGRKKITKFTGSTYFCSDQMLALLSAKIGEVDLYFNDIISLGKSFISPYLENQGDQNISQIESSAFQIRKMKFELYSQNYEQFNETWKNVKKQYFSEIDEIQIELMHFFKDLKINHHLRDFYWKEIDENIREMAAFQQLRIFMQEKSFYFISEIVNFPSKQEQYANFLNLYKKIKIQCSDFTRKQTDISLTLLSKQNVNAYFQEIEAKLQENYDFVVQSEAIKLNVVVTFYATFAENKYQASVEDKIKACNLAIKVLEKENRIESSNQNPFSNFFQISVKQLCQVAHFYQIFWFKIWKDVPQNFRDKSALNSIVNLYLISPPLFMSVPSLLLYDNSNYLIENNTVEYDLKKNLDKKSPQGQRYFQKQLLQDQNNSEQSCFSEKKAFIKIKNMCLFWQFSLVHAIFKDSVFYIKQNQTNNKKNLQHIQDQIQEKESKWMDDHLQNQVLKINKDFYHNLGADKKNFNERQLYKLLKKLQNPQIIELQHKYFHVKRWKFLIKILTYIIIGMYCMVSLQHIFENQLQQMVYFQLYKDNIVLHRIILFFFGDQNLDKLRIVFNKVDQIFNCKQLYFRFSLQIQLQLQLKGNNWTVLKKVTQIIKKEINFQTFLIEDNQILIYMIKILASFIENSIKKSPTITQGLIHILSQCFQFISLGWQICFHSSLRQKQNSFFSLPYKLKLSFSEYSLYKLILSSISFRSFHSTLVCLGEMYKKIFFNKNYQNHKLIISQHHLQFIDNRFNCLKVQNFASKWLNILIQHPELKKMIKSNSIILNLFIKYHFKDFRTMDEILAASQVIDFFFQDLTPEDFYQIQKQKTLPPLAIAFSYYKIKLIKTKYGHNECEDIIKLYQFSVKENIFLTVLTSNGLLRFIFNAFIYTQKPYEKTFQYLQHLCQCIGKLSQSQIIYFLTQQLSQWFQCVCQFCFPRKPENWQPQKFTEYLYQHIQSLNPIENPYMSLVFYYSLNRKELSTKLIRKFSVYILRSIKFIVPSARRFIFKKIHVYIYVGFYLEEKHKIFSLVLDRNQKMNSKISKSQKDNKIHRRFIHNYLIQTKYDQSTDFSLQNLLERIFVKELYFYDYKYPKRIKEIYKKKMRRFFQVKQDYQRSSVIQDILRTNYIPYYESLKRQSTQIT